jgi:type VI protein secretion system component Hcp
LVNCSCAVVAVEEAGVLAMPIGGELNDSNSKNEGMVVSQQQNMTGKKKEHLPQQQQKQTWRAGMFMIALAIQYGVQPLISKRCTGKQVIMTSAVLTCEIIKVSCCCHPLEVFLLA